jgi:Zn-dependent peptidase ImmA (M78 family)
MAASRLDLALKLRRYRERLQASALDVAMVTGLPERSLAALEGAERTPTAEELRQLAGFYRCPAAVLAEPEASSALDVAEPLFLELGRDLCPADRRHLLEFVYLCENEDRLWRAFHRFTGSTFAFTPEHPARVEDGARAAAALRSHFEYEPTAVAADVYSDLRRLGIHVFRRRLEAPHISGLYLRHPVAGPCVLVNFVDDVYRQRFAAAHEAAHALLDVDQSFVVSFARDDGDPVERRADVFAASFLMPTECLMAIPEPKQWDRDKAREWARKLLVNVEALAFALRVAHLIGPATESELRDPGVPRVERAAGPQQRRVRALLEKGLSDPYVQLCFAAYEERHVTREQLAAMLLATVDEVAELAELYRCEPARKRSPYGLD